MIVSQVAMNQRWASIYVVVLALLGLSLRLLCASRGHNFDIESYRIVADIMERGGNVYNETSRYNYGPVWFYILHGLDRIPWLGGADLTNLRWKVAVFLSIVDVGIFLYLVKEYSIKAGVFFLFNPISIIITGYHSQFDNLAILVGLLSVHTYGRKDHKSLGCGPLIGIGFSLCIKHILFLFPVWLAFKAVKKHKLATIFLPYLVFFCGFIPFFQDGETGIIANVLHYKSFNNAPLWSLITPHAIYSKLPPILLFVVTLSFLGLYFKKTQPEKSFLIYTVALVCFSSAIANQYLAICIPAIAVLWNRGYFLYTVTGTVYLLVNDAGLHIHLIRDLLGWQGGYGYNLMAVLLAYGFLITAIGNPGVRNLVTPTIRFGQWLQRELMAQVK